MSPAQTFLGEDAELIQPFHLFPPCHHQPLRAPAPHTPSPGATDLPCPSVCGTAPSQAIHHVPSQYNCVCGTAVLRKGKRQALLWK